MTNRESSDPEIRQSGQNSFRSTLQFYLIDCTTPLGKFIDVFIIFLNILVCILFVVETYPISDSARAVLWNTEIVVVSFFMVEYVLRLYAAPNRRKYFLSIFGIIDLLAILPTMVMIFFPDPARHILFLQIIRSFKVMRIFRFLRFLSDPDFFFGHITFYVLKVARLMLTILVIFFVSSGLFFYVENGINNQINTFGDAFYYTVVTLTTVGFGDITPVSELGRLTTVLMILSGIVVIPWQASQIVREWLRTRKDDLSCPACGLRGHDLDASHCKACGSIIYQEYEG